MANKDAPNPMAALPDPPAVSMRTIAITGILCDIYGLEDLPSNLTHVSVLWLHNPRMGNKERMAHIAQRAVGEYNSTRAGESTRGFIAAAFGTLPLIWKPQSIHSSGVLCIGHRQEVNADSRYFLLRPA